MANAPEVAKAVVTIVPVMQGAQAEITSQLTGVADSAAESAGESSGSKFGEKFAGALKGASAAIGAAIATAAGAAIATGKAFVDAAASTASFGDEIQKNAQKMNLSYSGYQELDFILGHCDVSIESMKSSMLKLTKAAEGGSEAFEALGISQEDLANMSTEDLFNATIAGLQNCTDESERMMLTNELLGKSAATELAPLLNMTAEETEALRQQVHELGGVMSDEAVEDAATFQDELMNMQTSLDGLKHNMMAEFLPGISSVMSGLSKVFSGNSSGMKDIEKGLGSVIQKITALAPQFFSLAETLIMSLISGFGPMLPQLAESVFNIINQGLLTVTSMLPQLLPAIESGLQAVMSSLFTCLPLITQSLLTLVTDLVVWLASGDNITLFVNGIIQLVTMICDQISVILPVLLPAIVEIVSQLALALSSPENIETLVGAVLQVAGAVFVALVNCVPVLIDFVIGLFDNLGSLLADFLSWIVPIVAEGLEVAVNTVKGWLNTAKDFLSNIGSNIRTAIQNWINNVRTTITSWIENIKSAFNNWLTNLKNSFVNGFNFIRDKISNIVGKAKDLVTNIVNIIKELPSKVTSIGKNLVEGLWNGINDKISWVKNKIAGMGSAITNAIKGVFGIASPSKLWRDQIGSMLAEGLGIGFVDTMDDVKEDMIASMDDLTFESKDFTASMVSEVQAYGTANAPLLDGESSTVFNNGGNTINVYAAEGQDVESLAQEIAYKLEEMTRRRETVYA